jgi:tRNA 2-thiouridine synthesizing protein E
VAYADIEKSANGYLVDTADWSEDLAREIAKAEGIAELTEKHWDLLHFLREEFFDNNGHQPNERGMCKGMAEKWGGTVGTKDLYDLYPMQPSKQATKIAGLPETKRKGGY